MAHREESRNVHADEEQRRGGEKGRGTAEDQPHRDEEQRRIDEEQGRSWVDEAAAARTSDDPRARTPHHDAAGTPSIGRL